MDSILKLNHSAKELHVEFVPNELNLFNIDEISQTYMDFVKESTKPIETIYFKLDNIKAIDSSSVAFLVRAHLNAKKNNRRLILRSIPENLKKTLDFANLLKDFEVE
jgi:anti-anti-sigma factor